MTLFLFIRNKSRDPTGLQTYLDLDHLTNANSSCAYWLLWLCLKPGNWFETTDQRWSIGCLVVANCLSEVDLSKWRVEQAQAACGKFVSSEQTFMRTCGLFMRRMSPCPCFMDSGHLHRIAIITHVVFTNQPTTALAVIRQLLTRNQLVWNIPLLFRTYELLYQRLSIFEAEDIFEETKCLKPCTYKDYRFPL